MSKTNDLREKLRSRDIFDVTIDDMTFTMKVPTVSDLVRKGYDPIVAPISDMTLIAQAGSEPNADDVRRFQKFVADFHPRAVELLHCAMVDPQLHVGEGECPEGMVTPDDLGSLVMALGLRVFGVMQEATSGGGEVAIKFRQESNG